MAAARLGPVFPLRAPRAAGPKHPAWGLHSAEKCPGTGYCRKGHLGWNELATADPGRIERCWTASTCRLGSGVHNIGLPTGRAGLVVIDCDLPKGPADRPEGRWDMEGVRDGLDMLTVLAEECGQAPPRIGDTFTVTTPSGGTHLYYRAPPGIRLRNTTDGLGWRIDTRAAGGYVVAPGSMVTTAAGTCRYEVTADVPIVELPAWITRRLQDRPPPAVSAPAQKPVNHTDGYVQAALDGEAKRIRTAKPGGRNQALFVAACSLGRLVPAGALTEVEARAHLEYASSLHVPAAYTSHARDATITSGLRHGIRRGGHPITN
ncbi:bifunctional DNA primase/polymerase [Actinoalloteichus sp. GBA129-24]|uniref:bifunctional DNA primase/polymerase n=1 Tax=Actinoalloteichus sp. GBA129-24 TaxID=1612551 RepID=UPI0009529EF3|nr:bifunctional DNA primase/polymerase [Actinoalloteichus sp. GBA129-24]